MKRLFLSLLLSPLLLTARPAGAVYWDPVTHDIITTYGSNCTLTPDKAQKSATTVYTLNIDQTNAVNTYYVTYWGRYPRCDELQYHAEHNTSLSRLKTWLLQVERRRITSHQIRGTVLTADGKLWQLMNNYRRQLYDWPTMAAWGFLVGDIRRLNAVYTDNLYAAYQEQPAPGFSEGPYAAYVQQAWHDAGASIAAPTASIGTVPQSLQDDVALYGLSGSYGMLRFRNPCLIGFNERSFWVCKNLDMSFALQNSCQVLSTTYSCDDGSSGDLHDVE